MAKGKSSRYGTREPSDSLTVTLRSRPSKASSPLSQIQDLRTFDFEPATRPALLFSGAPATVGPVQGPRKKNQARSRVPYQIAFNAPSETLVCVRRARRKEVLFAKKKTGKRGQRKARWSKWSPYKC